jgi:hypothetical protein
LIGSAASACPAAAIENPIAVAPSSTRNDHELYVLFDMIFLPEVLFEALFGRLSGAIVTSPASSASETATVCRFMGGQTRCGRRLCDGARRVALAAGKGLVHRCRVLQKCNAAVQ